MDIYTWTDNPVIHFGSTDTYEKYEIENKERAKLLELKKKYEVDSEEEE